MAKPTNKKQKYVVTGWLPVLGHQPGDEFVAELDDDTFRRFVIDGGHLEIATTKEADNGG